MDKIQVCGGSPLSGSIQVRGAKNATLPLMAACILTDQTLTLSNLPHLSDVTSLANLLAQHGVTLTLEGEKKQGHVGRVISLTARKITSTVAPYELVRKMRASILVLGPLLARTGQAIVSLPGGCAIGTRPVDFHIKGLEALGATIELKDGYIMASAPEGLQGNEYTFPTVTVTGTENILMAATLAKGTTVLKNAACEPEVVDLANCLQSMGAKIEGIGTSTLTITGVEKLHGAEHFIVPDRIETGSYVIAVAMAGGKVEVTNTSSKHIGALIDILKDMGVHIEDTPNGILVERDLKTKLKGVTVETAPYPEFPTDLQAQLLTLTTLAEGTSIIDETIFENRFMHVPELVRMGAKIKVNGSKATVQGVDELKGAPVMATDLRASISLIIAGLAAKGTTLVNRIYHLDRGYERVEERLANCAADIKRITDNSDKSEETKSENAL